MLITAAKERRFTVTAHPEASARAELEAVRRRERHAAAVARTAARVASERSLPTTLRALAQEILQADGLAGVQVLTNEHADDTLHMLGVAGFAASGQRVFFSRLVECQRRGAELRMLEVMRTGEPVVVRHRYATVMEDPAWEPLREYHRSPVWDDFASLPITVRQHTIGILNVFFTPGTEVDDDGFDFLAAMAEQAGLAIDYASLLEQERSAVQREERQRLARDLHDSVVQQVFSMGMLTQALKVLSEGQRPEAMTRIREIATDLEEITGSVLLDLRGLVAQLRPGALTGEGLADAVAKLGATTHRQTGIDVEIQLDEVAGSLEAALVDDLYFVIAEAVHNAIKHAAPDVVVIQLVRDAEGTLELLIRDHGDEQPPGPAIEVEDTGAGHGLNFMRERVERWHGEFRIGAGPQGRGTEVRALIPHHVAITEEES
ncbi:MAG: GAF domain-containing sensor histidine kinase [Micrococcaceae bacterium]